MAERKSPFLPRATCYVLALHHNESVSLPVGARGNVTWSGPWLFYVGRASYGWTSRLKRYGSDSTKTHWHIDYFVREAESELVGCCPVAAAPDRECDLARALRRVEGLELLKNGLGASDCGSDCRGHIYQGDQRPVQVFSQLIDQGWPIKGWVQFRIDRCDWIDLNG